MVVLENRVAIVTGGSRGIGEAISKELARYGTRVVINYHSSKEKAESLVKKIKEMGSDAICVKADVSNEVDAKMLIDTAVETFGRLDILVNNAGITRDRTFKKLSGKDWRKVIDVNLNSAYNTTSFALPHLLASDAGRIVNISSIIGQAGGFGQTNYSAAKAGLLGFTKSLALETAKTNVTVNAICPGFINTDMVSEVPKKVLDQIVNKIPAKRLGEPNEIARGVLFLCRDGEYITGQELNINGGLYM